MTYQDATYDPLKGVGYLLNRVRHEIASALDHELTADEELAALDVSSAQFIVIATLATSTAPITTSQLRRCLPYNSGAMTRMIDRLEAKGLTRRLRRSDDRRAVYLELTEVGRSALPRMRADATRVLSRFLQGFSQDDQQRLESLLDRMLRNVRC